jgi:hypothetical protein
VNKMYAMGRRPKSDDFDDFNPFGEESEEDFDPFFDEEGEEEVDEEVDFENRSFGRDQIWNDYADDLDFDE